MRFTFEKSDDLKAFITGDNLFIKRDHDGKWTCFSAQNGWQDINQSIANTSLIRADRRFYKGDKVTIEF